MPPVSQKYRCQSCIRLILVCLIYWEYMHGLLQLFGALPCPHHLYSYTGSFYNPGPYACFLAIGVPLALRWTIAADNKLQKLCGIGIVAISAILIPATLSRTACAACVIGSCVALADKISAEIKTWNNIHWGLVITALAVITVGSYMLKKDSANGRLLLWTVAVRAAVEAPINGVGWDRVAGAYGEAQEQYFASNEGSETEVLVADAPEYVFNEYLQVAIAYGIPIAITITTVLIGGVIVAIHSKAYGLAGSAVTVAVVMMASYPLQFPLFVAAIGLVLIGCYLSSSNMIVSILGSAAVIGLCMMFLTNNHIEDVRTKFAIGHSLHKTRKFRKSNDILLALLHHSSDPMILNIIGKNYQSLGIPDSAEYYLMKSTNRCPNRLYPHYLLMNLYSDSLSYNQNKMIHEAEILITMKEKVPSPAVDEMRQKARVILNTFCE